jgi:hypothetical protein
MFGCHYLRQPSLLQFAQQARSTHPHLVAQIRELSRACRQVHSLSLILRTNV